MFTRETIKFLIPTSLTSILSSSVGDRKIVPLYINPSQVQTNYAKNISETQTIGGFIIQYWGDKITTIAMSGTTGSGGIDAINILYEVYKSEQTSFRNLLIIRRQKLEKALRESTGGTEDLNIAQALDQVLLNGAFSEIANGWSESMDYFKMAINGESPDTKNKSLELMPTLSAFAVSLEMHYQGKVNRGYIESMNVTEDGNNPGHFNYSIQFKSLKEYGERNNFMPWHINPRDESGNPVQKPRVGPNGQNYNLSFPIVDARTATNTAKSVTRVTDDQVGTSEENGDVTNFSRRSKITSK
jgi:hypothetical protein